MCEEFSKFYGSVFTKEKLGHIPEATREYKNKDDGLCDIEITEEKIINKLGKLRDDKSGGVDELVPRFLNSIKHDLKVPLSLIHI